MVTRSSLSSPQGANGEPWGLRPCLDPSPPFAFSGEVLLAGTRPGRRRPIKRPATRQPGGINSSIERPGPIAF